MTQQLQILILGLSLGGVYAIMATGLTLIFGVMRIVNLAHPAFIIIAAYISYFLFQLLGLDPILSILVTVPAMFVFGLVVYRLFFAHLKEDARFTDATVLISFALALGIEGLLAYFFTGIYRTNNPAYATETLNLGPLYFPQGQFYATIVSVLILIGLWAFLRFTRLGYAIRATSQNRVAAETVGVNVKRVSLLTFGIGTALAGASGSLISFLFTFYPARHIEWIAILMSLIVLGGLGSLLGALVGAIALAVVSAFVGFYYGPTWSPITFYLALFLVLLFKPEGLFGKKVEAQ